MYNKPLKLKKTTLFNIEFDIKYSDYINQDIKYGDYLKIDNVKNKIDKVNQNDWTKIRKVSNLYETPYYNTNKKIISRAFYKLYEMLHDYKIISDTETLHLCEAPGGFIQAMLEYKMKKNNNIKKCHTISLISDNNDIPKYNKEIINDNRVNIIKFNNGDIYKIETLLKVSNILKDVTIGFITADGGITDNGDFNNKEVIHIRLILSQIFITFLVLENFGDFVLKFFDIFTDISVHIIFLLNYLFDDVYITKPLTSRPTNSEKYLICKGFIKEKFTSEIKNNLFKCIVKMNEGYTISSLIDEKQISKTFIDQIKAYNELFISNQIKYIEDNLSLLNEKNINLKNFINKKKVYGKNWLIKYMLN